MKINIDNTQIHISFDKYGNLYLSNNKMDNECYQINVNNKNQLYLDYYNYNIIKKYENIYKKFGIEEQHLKKKINKEIENIKIEDPECDEEEEEIYIPEDESLYIENDNDNDNDNDNYNICYNNGEDFEFFALATKKLNIFKRNENIQALYNTYVYVNNELQIMSRSIDSCYILKIYDDIIYFRAIGSKEYKYKITTLDNKININLFNN